MEAPHDLDDPNVMLSVISCLPGLSGQRIHQLMERLPSLEQLFQYSLGDLLEQFPVKAKPGFKALYQKAWASPVGCQYLDDSAILSSVQARRLTCLDPHYPDSLTYIGDHPAVLFVRGNVEALNKPQIAVVGSRNVTTVGADNAFRFSAYLSAVGLTITSGLAVGVDAQAHRGALHSEATTVAVMATGIDRIYPSRHKSLAQEIVKSNGCLVSEFRPGTPPRPQNFPRRNRIVSGLSLGVLVVEAAVKSGSLITARLALEQNREVFAIPGSIHNPQARGCHSLIKQGAILVESAMDIAEPFKHWCPNDKTSCEKSSDPEISRACSDLEKEESQVLDILGFDFMTLEELALKSQCSAEQLLPLLMSLQLKGFLAQEGAGYQRL